MKRTISVLVMLILIFGVCALSACDLRKKPENVLKIEEIIKEGMAEDDKGRYYIGAPYGNIHYAEIRRNGDGEKIDIAIYTPGYSSHMACPEDFEICVVDELTPYCQTLYFEYEETIIGDYWEMSEWIVKDFWGYSTFFTGKLYYISPETGEKYELDLK